MSFPRYLTYKDIGVKWLGEVPEEWTPMRLKFLLRDGYDGMKIGPFGSQLTSGMLDDQGMYKVYGQENVIYKDFQRGSRFIGDDKFRELSVYEIRPGDLLVTMMGTSGRCDVVPEDVTRGIMDSHLLRVRLSSAAREDFVRLLIDEAAYVGTQVQLTGKGSIMHGLNSSIVKDLLLVVPPVEEQNQILTFLDGETAKIDALVAEQRRLIDLLKEKRQAVVSQAVTKGLNPHVPMKPSGIEWLGDVPAHWEGTRLRFLFRQEKRQNQEDKEVLSVYRDYGVILKESRDDNMNKTPEDLTSYQLVNPGDLVVNKMKAWQGSLGVSDVEGITSPDYVVFAPRHQECSAYLHLLLRSQNVVSIYRSISNGIRPSQWRLEPDLFTGLVLFIPPLAEQQGIVTFVEGQTARFDGLTAEAQRAIDLLQERRTALISAAVTGKIDVRGLAETEAA